MRSSTARRWMRHGWIPGTIYIAATATSPNYSVRSIGGNAQPLHRRVSNTGVEHDQATWFARPHFRGDLHYRPRRSLQPGHLTCWLRVARVSCLNQI
jgi:hypothetical protein